MISLCVCCALNTSLSLHDFTGSTPKWAEHEWWIWRQKKRLHVSWNRCPTSRDKPELGRSRRLRPQVVNVVTGNASLRRMPTNPRLFGFTGPGKRSSSCGHTKILLSSTCFAHYFIIFLFFAFLSVQIWIPPSSNKIIIFLQKHFRAHAQEHAVSHLFFPTFHFIVTLKLDKYS